MFLVVVSWAIFAIEDFSQLRAYLAVMFGLGGAPLADGAFGYYLRSYLPVLCAAALASTPPGRVPVSKAGEPDPSNPVYPAGAGRSDPVHRLSGGRDL